MMSSTDQSLKRAASPGAEEAQPEKRQKPDDNSDVSGVFPQIENSPGEAIALAHVEGTQMTEAKPEQQQIQSDTKKNVSAVPDIESPVEAAAVANGEGTQAEESKPEQQQTPHDKNNNVSDTVLQLEDSVTGAESVAHEKKLQADSLTNASTEDEVSTTREVTGKGQPTPSGWVGIVNNFSIHGNNTGFFSEELRKKGHNSRPQMQPDERRRLMEDLAEHNDTHEPQGQPKVGLDFMSEFSTAVDSPKDAATFLGVDLQSPEISPESTLKLRIDQVQNIAFMVKKAEGILKGCVNANDYGTGKSVEALASVFFLAQRREACPDFGAYKAVLILCPHQAIRGWQETHAKFFSGLLSLHICSKSLSPGEHSQLIDPPSAPALAEFLGSLSPSDPQTGRAIILCTYGELSSEEFMVQRKSEDAREKELSLRGSKLTEEALEALKVAQKPELYDLNFDPKIIGTLIVDEAHEIKHPKSRRAQMTYLLNAEIHFLLTANPVDNRISDFRGLLLALYRSEEWQINWPAGAKFTRVLEMFDDHFNPFVVNGSENFVPHNATPEYTQALRNGQHLWRLNPHAYRWLAHQMRFGPEFSRRILRSIFRLCLLRRGVVSVTAMPGGGSPTISGILALPPISIRTIEVSMGDEKEEYDYLAERGFNFIFHPGGTSSAAGAARVINDNETPLAAFDNFWDTFLSHMTADLGLADVLRKSRSSESSVFLPDIDDLLQNNTDSGMSFYYRMTRRETDPIQPPADRASMIRHLVRQSPKLRWLLFKLEELKKKGEKVIVYCVHPLTQWLVEGVCSMAEFSFLSLRSKPKHGDETRATVIDEFNDPGKRHEFLLSTVGVLGYGVDLHADCHNMIIFELPDNIPTMLSAIGRIRRVGQTKPQEVSILTLKDSYDDYTLCRQSRKHATAVLAFGVLGARLDELAFRVDALVELDRRRQRKKKSSLLTRPDLRRLKRELPVLEVVKLLAAGELLRQHLGAQYNTSYDPWKCRRQRLFHFERMKLVDFAGANMDFNTETGRMILHRVAQFPASGPPCAGVGFLPSRFQD